LEQQIHNLTKRNLPKGQSSGELEEWCKNLSRQLSLIKYHITYFESIKKIQQKPIDGYAKSSLLMNLTYFTLPAILGL
jgi:hypothetical protein